MPNNGKKEFPNSGLEQDVTSKFTRRLYCYIKNTKGLTKFVKRTMNKRFRRFWKSELAKQNINKEN